MKVCCKSSWTNVLRFLFSKSLIQYLCTYLNPLYQKYAKCWSIMGVFTTLRVVPEKPRGERNAPQNSSQDETSSEKLPAITHFAFYILPITNKECCVQSPVNLLALTDQLMCLLDFFDIWLQARRKFKMGVISSQLKPYMELIAYHELIQMITRKCCWASIYILDVQTQSTHHYAKKNRKLPCYFLYNNVHNHSWHLRSLSHAKTVRTLHILCPHG